MTCENWVCVSGREAGGIGCGLDEWCECERTEDDEAEVVEVEEEEEVRRLEADSSFWVGREEAEAVGSGVFRGGGRETEEEAAADVVGAAVEEVGALMVVGAAVEGAEEVEAEVAGG
jgi:hypothetical protein